MALPAAPRISAKPANPALLPPLELASHSNLGDVKGPDQLVAEKVESAKKRARPAEPAVVNDEQGPEPLRRRILSAENNLREAEVQRIASKRFRAQGLGEKPKPQPANIAGSMREMAGSSISFTNFEDVLAKGKANLA